VAAKYGAIAAIVYISERLLEGPNKNGQKEAEIVRFPFVLESGYKIY
jgi:hypothetical protein